MVFWRWLFRAVLMQSGNSITRDRDELNWVKWLIIIIINGGIFSPDRFPPLSSRTKTHHGGNMPVGHDDVCTHGGAQSPWSRGRRLFSIVMILMKMRTMMIVTMRMMLIEKECGRSNLTMISWEGVPLSSSDWFASSIRFCSSCGVEPRHCLKTKKNKRNDNFLGIHRIWGNK